MSLAAGAGPIVGGELVRVFGWSSVFLANLPVLAVSALLAIGAPRPARPRPVGDVRFDRVGTMLLTAGLIALVTGVEDSFGGGPLVVGLAVVLLLSFVLWERRAPDPVIAFSLFRSRTYTAGTLLIALQNLVMVALLFEIPMLLDALFSLDAEGTGQLLAFMMLTMVTSSLAAGWLTDRLGSRPVAVTGTLACIVAIALMRVNALSIPGDLRVPLALLGLGLGLATPAAQSAALAGVAGRMSGMAAGVGSTVRYLGGIVGVALLVRVVDPAVAPAQLLHDHRTILTVCLGVLVAGFLCAVLLVQPSMPLRGMRRRLKAVRADGTTVSST